jgi:hypothetical protein
MYTAGTVIAVYAGKLTFSSTLRKQVCLRFYVCTLERWAGLRVSVCLCVCLFLCEREGLCHRVRVWACSLHVQPIEVLNKMNGWNPTG